MKPKQFNKNSSYQYETEVVWESPDHELVWRTKKFLNGKAILFIRRITLPKEVSEPMDFRRLQFTVMRLNKTQKPKYVAKTGIQLGTGEHGSWKRCFTGLVDVAVTGEQGNIVIMWFTHYKMHFLLMLTFDRNGTKIVARSKAGMKVSGRGELKVSPDSKFVFFFSGHVVWTYKIVNGRSIEHAGRIGFTKEILRPKPSMIGTLTHIFPYENNKVIVLLSFGFKHDLKFMVFSYKKGKIDMVENKVKNADAFTFRGEVKFYRKNGKIYFYDQKEGIYRLTL